MSTIDNINGIYAKDTEVRNGISELRGDILSQTIKPLNVTENGTYTSDPTAGAYGYSPVTVNVSSSIDYSTTEQDTGRKWIDGKPIYSKTWYKTAMGNYANERPANIDTIVSCEGAMSFTNNNNNIIVPIYGTSASDYYNFYFLDNTLVIRNPTSGITNIKAVVTVYYTKTTDTAE